MVRAVGKWRVEVGGPEFHLKPDSQQGGRAYLPRVTFGDTGLSDSKAFPSSETGKHTELPDFFNGPSAP